MKNKTNNTTTSSRSRLVLVIVHLIILVCQIGFLTYLKKHNAEHYAREVNTLREGTARALPLSAASASSRRAGHEEMQREEEGMCFDEELGKPRKVEVEKKKSDKSCPSCPPILPCAAADVDRNREPEQIGDTQGADSKVVTAGGTTLNVMPILPSGGWTKSKIAGKALTIPHAVAELDRKTMKINIPPYVDRLCVDVGAHWSAPSSRAWWEHYPNTYVVAVEANPWSAYLLRYFGTKHYHDNAFGHMYDETHKTRDQLGIPDGEEVCSARVVQRCIKKAWGHWLKNEDKHTILHAAGVDQVAGASGASTTGNLGFFNPGLPNRTDVGSIFQLQTNYRAKVKAKQMPKPQTVPLLTVGELFEYLPTPATPPLAGEEKATTEAALNSGGSGTGGGTRSSGLVWDTLKIDAQGADTLVLLGSAHTRKYLSNFMCVIGEFDTEAYEVKDSAYTAGKKGYDHRWLHMQRYQKFLIEEHGFIMMSKHFFINPRYKEIFYRGAEHYNCRASDVRRSHEDIVAVLKRFESGDFNKKTEGKKKK